MVLITTGKTVVIPLISTVISVDNSGIPPNFTTDFQWYTTGNNCYALFNLMVYPISIQAIDAISMELSILYFEGFPVKISIKAMINIM